MKAYLSLLPALCLMAVSCGNNNSQTQAGLVTNAVQPPAPMAYTITNVYPHSVHTFTEGLEWNDNTLWESAGNYKESKLLQVDLKTGKALKSIPLGNDFFGEGITLLNGKIYQLTYKEGKCFVYDAKTLQKIKEFSYSGQGWGMTNDGKYLIMDDGSNNLYYRDPETFQVIKSIGVFDNNGPLASINELEYVNGVIYSNVWLTNYIVKIDPASGSVLARADFSGVLDKYAPGQVSEEDQRDSSVLNGIAYDNAGQRFFVTGKNWPKLFEVKFQ